MSRISLRLVDGEEKEPPQAGGGQLAEDAEASRSSAGDAGAKGCPAYLLLLAQASSFSYSSHFPWLELCLAGGQRFK